MKQRLFLVDGHALIFKMYYAFFRKPVSNSKGVDTSILFGFTKYLIELITRERPTHLAVFFDPPGGCFRNTLYPEYKANRVETPQLVIDALEPLTRLLDAMGVKTEMVPGFEADDAIGSAARKFASESTDVYMLTPDKDYGQIVGEHIFQLKPGKSGGDDELLGVVQVCQKWNISSPSQVIDILALCGDTADNVPGVQGVGPVGAAKLLGKYGDIKGIYDHISELTARQRGQFEGARDHIWLSRELVTIKTDVPLDLTLGAMALSLRYSPELDTLVREYELFLLKKQLQKITGSVSQVQPMCQPQAEACVETLEDAPADLFPDDDASGSHEVTAEVDTSGRVALDMWAGELYVLSAGECKHGRPEDFREMLEDEGIVKVGIDLKATMNSLALEGIELRGRLEDTTLMHYLLAPERSHKFETLCAVYLGIDLEEGALEAETSLFDDAPQTPRRDMSRRLSAILSLASALNAKIDSTEGLRKLYNEIEEPLVGVLSRMECKGVKVDMGSLHSFEQELRRSMVAKEAEVRELAGEPALNVSSPRQVGVVIYEKLALDPKAKKPRSGSWPTDEQTLQSLTDRSPIIDAILEFRGLKKLLSTYIEPFGGYVSRRDGRVHTTFNQALTATGRLSSSSPNLQNIPIRTELGKEIRRAFVAEREGDVIMSADYSQIELRLMAHFSGDEHLLAAFNRGEDVHAATAAKIFGISLEEVTSDQRRVAKTANFGIMYGISAFGLSQRLGISVKESKKIIDDYFASFPSIRSYIDKTLEEARCDGYTQTLFGRRRYLQDLSSPNANLRSLAERNAVNAPIQGSAADIIKLAMIGVDRALREESLKSSMVLQIHDELLLEVPPGEIERVREILVREMEGVVRLSVPLTVECNYGKTWLDAH